MNALIGRAEALRKLLAEEQSSSLFVERIEPTLSCASDLLDEGLAGEAEDLCNRLRDGLRPATESQELRIGATRGRALYVLGRLTECVSESRRLIEENRSAAVLERKSVALLQIYEGAALAGLSRMAEAHELLARLRQDLLSFPDSALLANCCNATAMAYVRQANWAEARRFALEAVVSSDRAGNSFWLGMANNNLAIAECGRCRWAIAAEAATQARDLFALVRNAHFEGHARRNLAITQWKRGKLAESLVESTACVEQAQESGHLQNLLYGHLLRSLVRMHLGEFGPAVDDIQAVQRELERGDSSRPALLAIEYLGDTHLEQGRHEHALELYDSVWPRALALVPRGDIVAELRRRMAECHLLAGKPAKAVEWCEGSLEHTQEIGDRYEEAATYRVLAMAQARLGQHELAKKAFDQGFALYDEIETPYEWGKLWLAYGDWLSADDSGSWRNLSAAHEAYRVALDHFEGMGAEHRLAQARARLEALDARVRTDGEELQSPRAKVRPVRKPRHSAETLRKAQWALETYGMVTRNRTMLDLLVELEAVAKSDMPIMVLGESGTGKELIAQGAHKLSGRVGRLVAINCSAIPASMLESEIFGHMKGSFTNAVADKPGLFEVADGGTLFLDEIGEMSLDLQAKLLRVLETGMVRRIGGTDDIRVRARVVAATNRDKTAMMSGNGFRSDLYYRLAHALYELPALRQRGDDVELLVEHFLARFNREHGKQARLTPSARHRLCDYGWPGNIRQLRAVLEKMVVSVGADGVLTPRDVPVEDTLRSGAGMMAELDAEEARRIRKALSDANGIKTAAAEILGISRTTLLGKMKRLGIE